LVDRYADCSTRVDIQQYLIHVEKMSEPKRIKPLVDAIMKARSIEAGLDQIAASGARCEYVSADVRDVEAMWALVRDIRARYGRIDSIIHAAGVVEDKLFRDKNWESFSRVYDTKTALIPVISQLMDELKLVVFFSSLSASFGNRGQCDYAAGNTVLDMAATVLDRQISGKVLSVAWGPWRGAGMVSPALEADMQRRGLNLLGLESGGEFFVEELIWGDKANVMALAGQPDAVTSFIVKSLTGESLADESSPE
jgi:NAD(P)-dependent dehydrogenase (short-subunit alcohol dehydrogenase family)